ncbi:hypothetical protein KUCAC02_023801 [Chaenocephalus aceratus]|uniref:Uncharacterized protein n=1 Tax=Chaenocephalus aceratus TaxID=36190 RepID=A0ACB9WFX7_CHAAC|nr:hypothetical protein KUCAC02_023801 [Chaenocephalus aceratus]
MSEYEPSVLATWAWGSAAVPGCWTCSLSVRRSSSPAGYDTFIRLWDLRLNPGKCVMEWEEPHDSALYCLQTDGNHMIASGSSYYGGVRLWDKRQAACLQFFQLSSRPVSSPVYCLRFSSSHLHAALASSLHSLDFRQNNVYIR